MGGLNMYISWLVLLIVVTHCIVVTVCGQQPCTYVMFASVTTAAYPLYVVSPSAPLLSLNQHLFFSVAKIIN